MALNDPVTDDNRVAVFHAVAAVLREEEAAWETARLLDAKVVDRFDWQFGVRSAPEVGVAYLVWKRVMCNHLVHGYVRPERTLPCGGRMDMWIGDVVLDRGLGIEFKFLMSQNEARTVAPQATRMCAAPFVASAAFIMWGHSIDEGARHHPTTLDWIAPPGWTPWRLLDETHFPAYYKGASTCRVWLYGADRL